MMLAAIFSTPNTLFFAGFLPSCCCFRRFVCFTGFEGFNTGGGVLTGGAEGLPEAGEPQVVQNFTPGTMAEPQELQTGVTTGSGCTG